MAGGFVDPETGNPFAEIDSVAGPEPIQSWGRGDRIMAELAHVDAGKLEEDLQARLRDAGETLANERRGESALPFRPLSYQEAVKLLLDVHRTPVDDDDALMMMVTLQGRFLEDLHRLLSAHDQSIEAAIKSTATTTVQAVNEALETLKDKTVRAGLSNAMALVERQAVAMDKFQRTNRRHLWIIAALTASSWIGLGLAIALLWGLLR